MRKKLLLLVIFFVAGLQWSFAQSPVIDSLKKLLNAHPQQDTVRVNLINKLALEIRRFDRKQMETYTEEGLKLAQQLNYQKGEGFALMNTAVVDFDKYDYSAAYANFDKSKQILEKIGDNYDLAILYNRRGRVYMDDGKHALSLNDYLEGIKLAEQTGNIRLAIDIKSNVGYLYNILGEYARAIPYYTEALNQAKQLGYISGMSGSYNAMGKTYKTQGSYPKALQAYQEGLKYDLQSKIPESIAIAYGNIGDVYERMANYPEAFKNINWFLSYYVSKPKTEDRK